MAELGFEIEDIERLIVLVEQYKLGELVVQDQENRLVIRGAGFVKRQRVAEPNAVQLESRISLTPSGEAFQETFEPENRIALVSPMVGVFFRASGPDSPPYVEVGDHVEVGQTIGVMEAMKVFSEIPAECAGTVLEIPAQNGQLVRPGDPLVFLMPD
jgi:acetyl-CoA carboxylase biotin carboxyl carrier protein